MADRAHEETDKMLESMERHLSAIYSRAQADVEKKADAFFSRFRDKDEEYRKLVEDGKMSETEYREWRKSNIMRGNRYTQMKEQIAQQLLHVNETATAYINRQMPEVYAINYNALESAVDGVGGYSFTMVDAETVRNLAESDASLLPYKKIDRAKDIPWNTKKINAEILQGILQGESIPDIAGRLETVTSMNETAAIRNARTMVTSAECKGRQDSYIRATNGGIELQREWIAAIDGRTRHAHRLLDGQLAAVDKPFKSELGPIMYPGDPGAHPANVYNCRCTMAAKVMGFKKLSDTEIVSPEKNKIKSTSGLNILATSVIIKLSDIQIGRSVGAKAINYDILDPATGEFFHLAEGSKIQNAEVFAGYGTKTPLKEEVAEGLTTEFGGTTEKWQHAKGMGVVDYHGEELPAEVHWFQEESIGKVKFKVKEWLE